MKVICTTTAQSPTLATRKFAAMPDWQFVIAGDTITPHSDYQDLKHEFPNVHYLLPEVQTLIDPKLSELIGWRSIQRRSFAFLYACKELKADVLATVDDDNFPLDGWGENLMVGQELDCEHIESDCPVFDPLSHCANKRYLWHRGFPLELLQSSMMSPDWGFSKKTVTPHIQADMWLGEPDVDAICRMVHAEHDIGYEVGAFPFTSERPSPFNSQNTFLHRDVMPHYFMHCGVGRFDDLVAAHYVQSKGFRVVYGKPSVRQERNEHDVMKDFSNELWGYQNILKVIRDLKVNPDNIFNWLTPRAAEAFRLYQKHFE